MAYLPTEVLKKLAEAAAKGSEAAKKTLKSSGNEEVLNKIENKEVSPITLDQPIQTAQPELTWKVQTLVNPEATDPNANNTNPDVQKLDEAVQKAIIKADINERNMSRKRKIYGDDSAKTKTNAQSDQTPVSSDSETVHDVADKHAAKFDLDAKYRVQTINVANADVAMDDEYLEMWVVSDTQRGLRESDSSNTTIIGRDNLEGIDNGTKYVLYNSRTGELFQYSDDPSGAKAHKQVQDSIDMRDKLYEELKLNISDAEAKKSGAYQALMDVVRDYGINLYGEMSDEQLAIVQPFIDRYIGLEDELSNTITTGDTRLNNLQSRIDYLQRAADNTGTLTISQYLSAKNAITKYEDLQKVYSGDMSAAAFKEIYNEVPSTKLLNSLAISADEAEKSLANSNATLVDDGLLSTNELNEKASNILLLDKLESESIVTQAEADAKDFNMEDNKQINSVIDIYRKLFYTLAFDSKGDVKKKAQACANLYNDYKTLYNKSIDTIFHKYNDTDDKDTIGTGLSGVLLASMGDASDIFTGWFADVLNARGFQGNQGSHGLVYDPYNLGTAQLDAEYKFKDGVLNNEDAYLSRAIVYNENPLHNVKAFLNNYMLAKEARYAGDIAGTLSSFDNVSVIKNGIDEAQKFTEEHPLLSAITDFTLGIVVDPTTYISGIAKGYEAAAVSDELVNSYTDDIVRTLSKSGISDDIIDVDRIKVILKNDCLDALKNGSNRLDAYTAERIISDYATPINISDFTELNRAKFINKRVKQLTEVIRDVSLDDTTANLFADSAKLIDKANAWTKLDNFINKVQLGYIGNIIPTVKYVKTGLDILKDSKGFRKVADATASYLLQLSSNAVKVMSKGSDSLSDFNKLTKAFSASHELNIIEAAIKNGDNTVSHLDEFTKLADNSRVEFARTVIDKELYSVGKNIQDSIEFRRLLTDNFNANDVNSVMDYVTRNSFLEEEALDAITVQLTTGKHVTYSEYINNLYKLAAEIDNPNAARSVRSTIDSYVNRIENMRNAYNNRVTKGQVAAMRACIADGSDTAINFMRTLDVSRIAPELREPLSNIQTIDEATKVADQFEKAVKTATNATGFKYTPVNMNLIKPNIDVNSLTPDQYIERVFAQSGAQLDKETVQNMVKSTIDKFDNPEIAGKYYIFCENAETNLNGILANKDLRTAYADETVQAVMSDLGYADVFNGNASLEAMDAAQFMLYNSFGPTKTYHAIMDTIAGSPEELNKLARQYRDANKAVDKELFLDKAVEYIKSHTNEVQEAAQTGVKLGMLDSSDIRIAVSYLMESMSDNATAIIPRRESIYTDLAMLNEKVLSSATLDADTVKHVSSKLENALNAGYYTTSNAQLGSILCGERLNSYLDLAIGADGYHANHMKAIMDTILSGENSVQLRTVLDADNAKFFVGEDMVAKCMDKGLAITEELNNYSRDVLNIYNELNDIEITAEQAELFRTVINNCSKNLTSPIDIRYLEYFNSIDFSDDPKKALAAIVDIKERLGIDDKVLFNIVKVKDPEVADVVVGTEAKKYIYKNEKKHAKDSRIVKTDNKLVQATLERQKLLDYTVNGKLYISPNNSFRIREELYDSLGMVDGKSRLEFAAQSEYAKDIVKRYDKLNDTQGLTGKRLKNLRQNQIDALVAIENSSWDNNVKRVMRWDKETLDHALLCTHSNAIVCDVDAYPELEKWLVRKELEGYVVTHTQLGGKSVQILSLDFNYMDPAYKTYLKNLQFAQDTLAYTSFASVNDSLTASELYDKVESSFNKCAETYANSNMSSSAICSKVNMDFHNELQQLIPERCRLDGTFTQMHNNAFCGNMLTTHELSNAVGATKGHLLGNMYYSECVALENMDNRLSIRDLLCSKGNSVNNWLFSKTPTANTYNILYLRAKKNGYHIVALDSTDIADAGTKYRLRDVTDIYDLQHYKMYKEKTLSDSSWDVTSWYLKQVRGKEHYVVDDLTYKYLQGDIATNNRMLSYYTTPTLLHQAADVINDYRSAVISGLLYGSNIQGTGIRNIIDSNTKALAELGTDKAKDYLDNYLKAMDAKQTYVERMAKIFDETGLQGESGINKYIENHLDDLDFDVTEFMTDHAIFTLNEMDDEVASKCVEIFNNKLLDSLSFPVDNDTKTKIVDAFNKVRDQHWLTNKYNTDEEIERLLYGQLYETLKDVHAVNSPEQLNELTKLYGRWKNGNTERWYHKMFDENNIVGKNLSAINKTTFDNAETRCRYAMMKTLLDDGKSKSEALRAVTKTQFDYGTQRGLRGGWDKLMPFANYQFCNAAYWLDYTNYSSFTLANMRRLYRATNVFETDANKVKTAIAMEYLKRTGNFKESKDELVNDPKKFFEDSISATIDNYKGVSQSNASGLDIGNHHFLKIGNGFADTMEWLGTVLQAPDEIAQGQIPTVLKDTVFGPLKTLPEAVPLVIDYLKDPSDTVRYDKLYKYLIGYTDEGGNYHYGNMSNLINCLPVFGQLFNMCTSVAKNVRANEKLMALVFCSEGCKSNIVQSLLTECTAMGFGVLNSVIGTTKTSSIYGSNIFAPYTDSEGNRVTWSSLSEDEKAKYTFLPGISNDTHWMLTPSMKYGLYGRLAQLGLDTATIRQLTDKMKCRNEYFKITSDGHTYVDSKALEVVVTDMLEQGYTLMEITKIITLNDRWYDVRTHKIIKSSASMQRELMDKAFLDEYAAIPEYIRYNPDMYKEMMAVYKAMGLSTREAWHIMRTDRPILTESHSLTQLSAEQVEAYEKFMNTEYFKDKKDDGFLEWYNTLPDYIKYEKGAYSRTLAYLKQMFSSDEAKQMIANGAYYTVDGRLINCKDLRRTPSFSHGAAFQDDNGYWHKAGDFQVDGYWFHAGDNPYLGRGSFQAYYNELPDYTKYNKGCYKLTNSVLKEAGFDYNTRMQAMLDGAVAMEIDPNSEAFQAMLAKQNIVAVTKTVYVEKQVPLRECSLIDGKFVWNGAQVVKCTDSGDGYTTETIQKDMEYAAAGMGLATAAKWKAYDAAMVTVKVPTTVVTAEQDPNQIMYRIVNGADGKTYVIVPAPPYVKPRGGYYKKGGGSYSGTSYNKRKYTYERGKRIRGSKLYGTYNKPMHIQYSNVRTFSRQHFLEQQGEGYKYWSQWGDGRMTNHRNRNGRMYFPSTYRNPRARQRNMYKELYGKFGASRMNQRQNIAGYSNASITRLRRNDIANRSYNIRVGKAII